ncbi:fibronectin type III domain-containing protein [Aquimarina pacifica]|uniref:hypothetical protein n=1 Tax=Aquimarina pacifica TaxID=1296415 RepID=UPI0005585A77|nr:hypothetical protein [Aquimarina pacifica]
MSRFLIGALLLLALLVGCEEVFIEEDLSEKEIVILAPTEGAAVENTSTTFSWEEVDQATEYRLQLAQPNFENASQILVDTTMAVSNFSMELLKNTYQWRIRAQNGSSATPYALANFSVIEIEDFSAREVILTTPEDDLITSTSEQTLEWQSVADALLYRVQLLDEDEAVITEETTTSTEISATFSEGVTQWQVRAERDTQSTLYTTRTVTLDTEVPNTPESIAPIDGATQTGTTVTFSWTREALDGTEEFDSIYIYSDQALTQLVSKDEITSPTDIELTASATYYWYLQSFDRAGNESELSDTLSFTIN